MKKIFSIVIIAVAIILAGTGIFFVNYSLGRKTVLSTDFEIATDEYAEIQSKNIEKLNGKVDKWRKYRKEQDWELVAEDGTSLYAVFYPANSHKYLIFCHGYGDSTEKFENLTVMFAEKSFNVLMPNLRGMGKTGSKYIGMGYPDSKDMLLWIDNIVRYDADSQIILMGLSMGGATVMMTSGLSLPDNVKCIVEDSGFSSVWEQMADRLRIEFKLPVFPIVHVSSLMSKLMAGYGFKEASAVERVKNAKVPMLFIHGDRDSYVEPYMLDEVVSAYGGPYSEKVVIRNAEHVRGYLMNTEFYFKTVFDFVDKFVK